MPWLQHPIVDKEGRASKELNNFLTKVLAPTQQVVAGDGSVHSQAPITGRTEGIGTTVGNLTASGQLASTDNIAADGTGSPLTGAKRAFIALDVNSRLANSFRANAVNVACVPTSAIGLTNDGVSTAIVIPSQTWQFGNAQLSFNSGAANPGAFGTFYVYADNPTFSPGALNFQFTTSPPTLVASDGRMNFGKIITVGGSAKTGGGNTGGTTPGGTGGRGVNLG